MVRLIGRFAGLAMVVVLAIYPQQFGEFTGTTTDVTGAAKLLGGADLVGVLGRGPDGGHQGIVGKGQARPGRGDNRVR